MKKIAKWIVVVLLVLLIVGVLGVSFFGGSIIKTAVNSVGPRILGVSVELEHAYLRPLAGKLVLKNLRIGNPEGFKTPSLFEVGRVDVKLKVSSLLSDPILIHNIDIESPHITYEQGLTSSNFGVLLAQLERADVDESADSQESPEDGAGRQVVIERLVLSDPALNVSVKAAFGKFVPIKLGRVELTDIGREQGGVSVAKAVKVFFSVITSNILNAISGTSDLLGSGADLLGDGASAAGDAAADGARAVGDAAADGARAVGAAASDGAKAFVKGLGGILGRENADAEESE